MKRSLVVALILSLGPAPAAIAGETLLQSGRRITRQLEAARPAPAPSALDLRRRPVDARSRAALQAQTTLAQTAMRKRTKILIGMGIAVAFGGVAYAIDRSVEDNTPSSLGLR